MKHPKKRLDDVADILMGQAPPGDSYNLEGDGWPLLAGPGDFKGDHPVAKKFTTDASKIGMTGDIVIGVRASIGDKVVADREYCLGRGVAALRAKSELHDRYLWYWLSSIKPSLEAKGKGATFKQVTKGDIAELEIPLPPLEEQRLIAAILDKASRLTAVQQKRAGLLEKIEASLFDQIAAESAHESRGCKLKELTADDDKINYGVVQPGNQFDGGIPLIRAGDLTHGKVDRTELKCIDPAIEVSYGRSRIKGNEILISCVGSIGAVATVEPSDIGSNIARAVARVPVSESVNRKWLAACLRSAAVQHYFVNELRTVSQPTLNIKQIEETYIQLPPTEIQMSFAMKLEAIENVLARSSASEAKTSSIISAFESMAFSGHF